MSDHIEQKEIERPPVVVVMGHIDHGKSTLLDYIRKSNIVSKEAGGITQHLGAYEVIHKNGGGEEKRITFLDTPGHEAFCGVRSRGAKVADIAILIVSAEDAVMPQTLEALECIKADNIPYIVAINKIDTPKANIEATKNSLVENEIYIEGYGGDVPVVEISAKLGTDIDELLDIVLVYSEVQGLKGNTNQSASGFVIEAHKDKNKGISATLVIKNGTLKQGQFVVCKSAYSPVRIFEDHNHKPIKEATFSTPIHICGWSDFPVVGAQFETFNTKKEAEAYIYESEQIEEKEEETKPQFSNSDVFTIPLIIKADTHGSIEAIEHELEKIKPKNAEVKVIKATTGNIGELDIKIASGHEASIVLGFGIDIDKQAQIMSERLDVTVKTFNIIYELMEWLEKEIETKRPRIEVEEINGKAKILKSFSRTNKVQVLGARVEEGKIINKREVRILRRDEEIARGTIKELQSNKAKVTDVNEGEEFGMSLETKMEVAPGDYIELFEIVKK
jgi:translation initiation factor IF-2